MIEITSLNNPLISEFINLKKVSINKATQSIILSSRKVLDKAIQSRIKIEKIFVEEKYIELYKDFSNLYFAKKNILEKIVGYKLHHGIFASAIRPKYCQLEDLDTKILVLNSLTSPENVGTIVRTATALNFNSIIFDQKCCCPYLQRCIRVSMGNIFYAKIFKSTQLIKDLQFLKDANYQIYSTANLNYSKDIKNFKAKSKFALIIGSEGHGIDQEIINFSDQVLKIKISDQIMHLNAAQAASISMFSLS